MSDNRKEAEEKMAKAIFISADCWLCVFHLLAASQLGLGISMISHRFDVYVDEHFKTRKWTLKSIRIDSKIGENGTNEMEIVNYDDEALPFPQIQLPRKVSGFEWITINFIDQNSIALKFDLNEMSDRPKEAEEKMAKAIFISGDCWLCVFDLLPLSQLGLGIALISHRFNYYVDEHFKTRKWALKFIGIGSKIGKNGTKEMEIVKFGQIALPIPQIQMPWKVIGFERISIYFIDQNAIAFLHRFRQLFAVCPINLYIRTNSDRILEFILRNIWPMFGKNILVLELSATFFRRLRQFAPSILNDCPSLRVVFCFEGFFTEFPCDDSAMASDGQAVAKWLFTPRPDGVPKVFKCFLHCDRRQLASRIEHFKAAFVSASSPANFIISVWFPLPFADSVVPFVLTNELTREQLTLKKINNSHRFLRCPIARDESKIGENGKNQ